MLNVIWLWLLILAVFIGGFTGKLNAVTDGAFASAKDAVMTLALPLAGLFALWLGIMRLAELSGLVTLLGRVLRPVTQRLFPDVPPEHPAIGAMTMNIAANMLGLGNAATPLGLRAMRDLETLNPRPGTATNAMCTFLAINTSSVQLIPATAIAILAVNGARNPTVIVGSAFIATVFSTIVALFVVKFLEKLPAYQLPPLPEAAAPGAASSTTTPGPEEKEILPPPPATALSPRGRVLLWLYWVGMGIMFLGLAFPTDANALLGRPLFLPLSEDLAKIGLANRVITVISLMAVPFMLTFFPMYAWLRGVKVYEEFVEGAKEGFAVAIRIIPFLVAILVAVRMFREAGGIALISKVLGPALNAVGFPVDLLPMVLVRPLSGGATTALFTDVVKTFGPDHFNSLTAATIFGSTETTFYVIAVYFGSVAVKRTRHAVPAGLIADACGIVIAVIVCRWMFT